ncbi:uncharacterized protein WM277_004784 [Molossus nigricans]
MWDRHPARQSCPRGARITSLCPGGERMARRTLAQAATADWVLNFRQSLVSQPWQCTLCMVPVPIPHSHRNLHEAPILPTLGPGTTLAQTQGAHFTEKAKPERQDAGMDGFPSLETLSRSLHPCYARPVWQGLLGPKPELGSKEQERWDGVGTQHRPGAQCHISVATIVIGLERGWLEAPGRTLGGSSTGGTLSRPSGQQRLAFHRVTPTRCHCRTRSRDRKRQAPDAKQPRRLGRRPFPPLLFLPQWRSGCHFETSGAVPLRPGPQGQSTDGRMMEDTLLLGHTPGLKSPTFHSLGTPQQLWGRGATPPHTLSSLQCCWGPSSLQH